MLRGVFMPAGVPKDAVDYYVELFKKVRATPEWAQLMEDGAFNPSFMTGADYTKWVETEEKRHRDLMKEAGFLGHQLITTDAPRVLARASETSMSNPPDDPDSSGPRQHHVEIGVAAFMLVLGVIAVIGSLQVGIGWAAEGPKSGFFPFWIGC